MSHLSPPLGSSPLTRGKRAVAAEIPTGLGLIPAHAGKTRPSRSSTTPIAAHPRSRGENPLTCTSARPTCGSSPLTRGKRPGRGPPGHGPGLIPAHAGKTRRSRSARAARPAHPRSRGENNVAWHDPATPTGSSPLTRGKPSIADGHQPRARLIPAHAGKTLLPACSRRWCGAHPRSRGENAPVLFRARRWRGSSPLTRGKPHRLQDRELHRRLIPAHAGKTAPRALNRAGRRAHPRSRGENRSARAGLRSWRGSSPLTRGKHLHLHRGNVLVRLIPAHAGKTSCANPMTFWNRAHPRSRGENRAGVERAGHVLRLIPAHAGKTHP